MKALSSSSRADVQALDREDLDAAAVDEMGLHWDGVWNAKPWVSDACPTAVHS